MTLFQISWDKEDFEPLRRQAVKGTHLGGGAEDAVSEVHDHMRVAVVAAGIRGSLEAALGSA